MAGGHWLGPPFRRGSGGTEPPRRRVQPGKRHVQSFLVAALRACAIVPQKHVQSFLLGAAEAKSINGFLTSLPVPPSTP